MVGSNDCFIIKIIFFCCCNNSSFNSCASAHWNIFAGDYCRTWIYRVIVLEVVS